MMKKNFTTISILLLAIMCVALFGCNKKENDIKFNIDKQSIELFLEDSEIITPNKKGSTFKSEDIKIATVSEDGKIIAVGVGQTNITVVNGDETCVCAVAVKEKILPKPAVNFYLDANSSEIFVQNSINIKAILYHGETMADLSKSEIEWTISDEQICDKLIAEDKSQIKLTGLKIGTASLTAKIIWENKEYTSEPISFKVNDLIIIASKNESADLTTKTTLSGANNPNANSYTKKMEFIIKNYTTGEEIQPDFSPENKPKFLSKDLNIATIDENGMITAINSGSTIVEVSYSGESCSMIVNVVTSIATKADLDVLGFASNASRMDLWGATRSYKLVQDIDYNNQLFVPIAIANHPGAPVYCKQQWNWPNSNGQKVLNIGDRPFEANFDGGFYSIKNVRLALSVEFNHPDYSRKGFYQSCMFGYMTGTVKNLKIDNVKFQVLTDKDSPYYGVGNNPNNRENYLFASGIIGQNYGLVENIIVTNADAMNTLSSKGVYESSAIFVAKNFGTMRNCIVEGKTAYPQEQGDTSWTYSRPLGIVCGQTTKASNPLGTIEQVYCVSLRIEGNHFVCDTSSQNDKLYLSKEALYTAHKEIFGTNKIFKYDETTKTIEFNKK